VEREALVFERSLVFERWFRDCLRVVPDVDFPRAIASPSFGD
jgi:hypothetical protein